MNRYLAPMPAAADGFAGFYLDATSAVIPSMLALTTIVDDDGEHLAVHTDVELDEATLDAWRAAVAAAPTVVPDPAPPADVPSVADAVVAALAAGRSKEDVVRDVLDAITT